MAKATGFLDFHRKKPRPRPVASRLKDWNEFEGTLNEHELTNQAARCMDCGIPFCHSGCPLGNVIPDWNDFAFQNRWQEALARLEATNNFPEFTGRVCPAPCEEACVLNIRGEPVTIKQIERQIADRAARAELRTAPAAQSTGKRVAIIGSGPAGLACAQQLARIGHAVTVFERDDRMGGLLRYGIPDFKLEKHLIDRRLRQLEAEGVVLKAGVNVGVDIDGWELRKRYDAVVLAAGAPVARELPIKGRDLSGIHLAMEYLTQQNRVNAGDTVPAQLLATGKRVVVLGGGDTGSDCVGTANRQGALSVQQLELLPRPPTERTAEMPWPGWPMLLRSSSSHEEGVTRDWSVCTTHFSGDSRGHVRMLHAVRVVRDAARAGALTQVPGSEFCIETDLVLLALGFVGPEKGGLLDQLGVERSPRGNVATSNDYMTNVPGVYACGDVHRGASLVVWAIWEGRQTAHNVDAFLRAGQSRLPVSPNRDAIAV